MKYFAISAALILSACGGFNSKQDFLKDAENQNKYMELSAKREVSSDCDKLGKLYEFSQKQSPNTDDLAQILPFLGLTAKDATDIDKVYKINYSIIDKYNCKDNTKQLLSERTKYCKDKYYDESILETAIYLPYRTVATVTILPAVITPILGIGALPFILVGCKSDDFSDTLYHPGNCRKKLDCEKYLFEGTDYTGINKEKLKQNLETKIKHIWPTIEQEDEYLLQEFKTGELIKAKQTVIGKYDDTNCLFYPWDVKLCDEENGNVTKLHVANILYRYCLNKIFFPNYLDEQKCICYAHSAYNQMSYKNILYVYEKEKMPHSKQSEFKQKFNQCEQKVKQRQIKANNARYGESDTMSNTVFNEDIVNGFIDSMDNAVWATQQINKEIQKERNKQK